MRSFALFLLGFIATTSARINYHRHIVSRAYVEQNALFDAYDFVIVGGGTAGLALASRLSANPNYTVLVIEAGGIGPDSVDIPAETYFKTVFHSQYDWGYETVPQPAAAGRKAYWPRGKLLGGSSAINGMYLIRPHQTEVNAWHDLISSQPDAHEWTWDNFFGALKKSETFTPPTDDTVKTAGIQWNADSHGTSGPVHATYPGYMVPSTQNWLPTLEAVGIPRNGDADGGDTSGGFFAVSAINPTNWTRSYSKSGYIDSLPPRSNLHILLQNTVTRILFDSSSGGLHATGVEFSPAPGATVQSVRVNKEAILCGGSINSPQILQLSGVGPNDVLSAAGVDVKLDLPGVGTHLQDHISAGVSFQSKQDTAGDIEKSGSDFSKSAEFLSFVNSGVAYVNSTTLFGADGVTMMHQQMNSDMPSFATSIGTGSNNSQVLEGFKTIYTAISDKIFTSNVGQVEMLFNLNIPGQIVVQAAIQHPLSQGRIWINTNSAFDAPSIDPQYFSHWADVVTMREGLKLARKIGGAAPLNSVVGDEIAPGSQVVSDDDWDQWLRSNGGTEFHPTSSCAMLPREQGGVVDNKLKVYGTSNVRIVDASVFPINFAAHTMAPVYGLAERAAEIILADYDPEPPQGSNNSDQSDPSSNGNVSNDAYRNINSSSTWLLGLFSLALAVFF
ncbi:CAZyme family AA3 [Agaricus bisporus var. burnettii]|uniref:pyranose dehydrogenase (acceptor) n=1 Tax=Agaricus bisporus var. burnettii TaxID=192524 RepID=A0A8H7F018_AGABI|nr:CAZyme family AA3 [Agaricus bisporus var. burnettii]